MPNDMTSNGMKKKIFDYAMYAMFRVRPFTRTCGIMVSREMHDGDVVLEIGSGGKSENKKYYFSMEKFFDTKKIMFIKSDLNPNYGVKVVDIEHFADVEKYNHILCFHVLDDVYEWQKALLNLYGALKKGGALHVVLPGFNGLDYKSDYYRFTEKLIYKFCEDNDFLLEKCVIHGYKRFPFAYYIRIKKL